MLTSKRKLRIGEVDLRLGNGAKGAAVVVGTTKLRLPSGDVLSLEDCYYVSSIIKNIIRRARIVIITGRLL